MSKTSNQWRNDFSAANSMPKAEAEALKREGIRQDATGEWPHGDYLIKRVKDGYDLLYVTRLDDGEIPAPLQGKWTGLQFLKKKIDEVEAKAGRAKAMA